MRRSVTGLAALTIGCAMAVAGCSDGSAPSDRTAAASPTAGLPASTAVGTPEAQCRQSPPRGAVDHSLQDFTFDTGTATVSLALPNQAPQCHAFPRWGNADPAVPLDSLLFLFKGPGSDGVTIDMLVGDLTQRTTVNARLAVIVDGTTYQSDTCSVELSALSSAGVAGSFTCPTATAVFGNPFAPLDEPESEPAQPAPLATAAVSGWFTAAP